MPTARFMLCFFPLTYKGAHISNSLLAKREFQIQIVRVRLSKFPLDSEKFPILNCAQYITIYSLKPQFYGTETETVRVVTGL